MIGQHVIETEKTEGEIKAREHEKSTEEHPHKGYQGGGKGTKTRDEAGGRAEPKAGGKERHEAEAEKVRN